MGDDVKSAYSKYSKYSKSYGTDQKRGSYVSNMNESFYGQNITRPRVPFLNQIKHGEHKLNELVKSG